MKALASASLAALLITAAAAQAQVQAGDPPELAGRVSFVGGSVSLHTPDGQDWEPAMLNIPLTTGAALWTDAGARDEVQIGASELRMDQATQVSINRLDYDARQITLTQGTVNIHLHEPLTPPMQIYTPLGEVDLSQPGTYRIDAAAPDASGVVPQVGVTALEGAAQVLGPRSLLEVSAGEEALLSGNPPTFMMQEGAATGFDDWALLREHREADQLAMRYASPRMTGLQDLDPYGNWSADPTYGAVWYPTTADENWAPYRDGHWAYIAPWGWTWVDNAPWGFAPFHYGRWAQIGGRWAWCPGEVVARPVYAPALVAFVGGPGWGVSISGGGPAMGWVPLAPFEVFHPYYHTSIDYVRNVNVTNVHSEAINNITVNNVNVTVNHFANVRAATVVPEQAFAHGGNVRKAFRPVPEGALAQAHVMNDVSHVTPQAHAPEPGREVSRPPESLAHVHTLVHAPGAPEHSFVATPEARHEFAPAAGNPIEPHMAQPQRPQAPMVQTPEHPQPPRVIEPQRAEVPHPQANAVEQREQLRREEVPHPEQHGHMTPTPQGWKRTPKAPKPQAHPQPHEEERHEER